MTLCVAVTVPSKILNPKRRSIVYSEPGIIIAADTRFSWLDGSKDVDDGIKVWPLNDWTIAGFSGDVELGEVALASMRFRLRELKFRNHEKLVIATKNWLRHYQKLFSRYRVIPPTNVLLCIYDTIIERFFLYVLSSQNKFEPRLREGMFLIGTGASKFKKAFPIEVDWSTNQWVAPARSGLKLVQREGGLWVEPRQPDDRENVPLIKVAGLVVSTLDLVLEKADIVTVGGLVQAFTLSRTGLAYVTGKKRSNDGAWDFKTAQDLRSYSNMVSKKYEIPHMRDDCSIE